MNIESAIEDALKKGFENIESTFFLSGNGFDRIAVGNWSAEIWDSKYNEYRVPDTIINFFHEHLTTNESSWHGANESKKGLICMTCKEEVPKGFQMFVALYAWKV